MQLELFKEKKKDLPYSEKTTKLTKTRPVLGELDKYDLYGMPKSDIAVLDHVYRCEHCGTIDQYETCDCIGK